MAGRESTRYIAYLRAINVGGHTVKMDTLRQAFSAIGLANVETFIASGNVIFESDLVDSAVLEGAIEHRLRAELGYDVATCVRTAAANAVIAGKQPFGERVDEGLKGTLYVGFMKDEPQPQAREALVTAQTDADHFSVDGRELFWLNRTGMGQSRYSGAFLERTLGTRMTVRNSSTVRKLALKYPH